MMSMNSGELRTTSTSTPAARAAIAVPGPPTRIRGCADSRTSASTTANTSDSAIEITASSRVMSRPRPRKIHVVPPSEDRPAGLCTRDPRREIAGRVRAVREAEQPGDDGGDDRQRDEPAPEPLHRLISSRRSSRRTTAAAGIVSDR